MLPCKKRYVIGVIAIIFLLWQCTDPDDDEYTQQRYERAADNARTMNLNSASTT